MDKIDYILMIPKSFKLLYTYKFFSKTMACNSSNNTVFLYSFACIWNRILFLLSLRIPYTIYFTITFNFFTWTIYYVLRIKTISILLDQEFLKTACVDFFFNSMHPSFWLIQVSLCYCCSNKNSIFRQKKIY